MKNINLSYTGICKRGIILTILLLACLLVSFGINQPARVEAADPYQIPTGKVPTVTSTPGGAYVTVRVDLDQNFVNLRAGPNPTYEKVGVLFIGQKAPAKGRSPGGEWYLVEYPGAPGGVAWVYAYLVNVSAGQIPVVELPPTPTPLVTPTINPTFAAQFVITIAPTRLATFTPPPPLNIPTFTSSSSGSDLARGVPMGMIIIGLAAVGLFLGLISFIQNR